MEKKQTHLTYGALTGLAIVILMLILHIADLSFETWAPYPPYLLFLIGLILNARAYSKANDGYVSFGSVFGSCFKASAIITLVTLAYTIVAVYIFPEIKERGMETVMEKLEASGNSDEQIEEALEMSEKFFVPMMIAGVVFGYMIVGAILSLIAAAIAPKKGETPFRPENPS